MSMAARIAVDKAVSIQNTSADYDLLNPDKTQTSQIAMLHTAIFQHGYKLLLTAINSDHSDDLWRGPHGHRGGFANDVGTINGVDVGDNHETRQFCKDQIAKNPWCNKLGTLLAVIQDPEIVALAAQHGVVIFEDEGTGPHVHSQSD